MTRKYTLTLKEYSEALKHAVPSSYTELVNSAHGDDHHVRITLHTAELPQCVILDADTGKNGTLQGLCGTIRFNDLR